MSNSVLNLLHTEVRRVVYDQRWASLRPIQVATIVAFFQSLADLLLVSATASGKTEAWLLPILSVLLAERLGSIEVVCVSPLKSLINDQYERLARLAKPLSIPIHAWHGDISQDRKLAVRKNPQGILIITPESLEAGIMNRSAEMANIFKHLQFVIIDEVHALLEEERGIHVRSLLFRLFDLIDRRPRLIGLSATIGNPKSAQAFLNPDDPDSVKILGL